MKKVKIKTLLWVFGALAGLVLAVIAAGFIWVSTVMGGYEQIPFEREQWLQGANRSHGDFPRPGMAEYLISKKTLDGMGRAELEEMLGEPDSRDTQWNTDHFDLVYWLGPVYADSEWLGITLDKRGKVSGYKIVMD